MITRKEKPDNEELIWNILNPLVKRWFQSKFKELALPQKFAVLDIHSRTNVLISAPTGSGKTLTAFLSILNELVDSAEKGILEDKVYAIYISPIRALSQDISVNLLEPLKEIEALAGKELGIRVAVRTGDTSSSEKQKMLKKVPHILITTPESLAIGMASPKFKSLLQNIDWCILDEVHAIAENKRGVDLSLSLERLQHSSPAMCRVGLSATIEPLEEIAKFLAGNERPCKIIDVQFIKKLDLKVISPVNDLINVTWNELEKRTYEVLNELIQQHKTTLIFTNTRAATERVVHNLKTKFGKEYYEISEDPPHAKSYLIGAHHGSLSKDVRFAIEQQLRDGKLKAVVCLEGNTKILDKDGKWVKIKDIEKIKVQSINKNLKINDNCIENIFKTKSKERLLKLKTQLGKEITCTKDHKFLVINKEGNLIWKKAKDIHEEEFVACIRKYSYKKYSNDELFDYTFKNYPDNYYLSVDKSYLEEIRSKILSNFNNYKSFWESYLKEDYTYSFFTHVLLGDYCMKVRAYKKIISILNLDNKKAFDSIEFVSSDKYKMPKPILNANMMRLIGFMLAEGYINDRDFFVSNRNEKLIRYYTNLIKKLRGSAPWLKIGSTGTPILGWSSMFLCHFLKNIGLKWGRKARIVNIPEFIFSLDSNLVFEFLSGYLDGDGYLEVKSGRVFSAGFCTASKEMAEDTSRLLLREGIVSSIRSRYCDEIQKMKDGHEIIKKGWFYSVVILGGDNLRSFAKNINPARDNLKKIKSVLELKGYSNYDVVPNLGKKLRAIRADLGKSTYMLQKKGLNPIKYENGIRSIGRKQLSRLLSLYSIEDKYLSDLSNSDFFWEKIKSIEKVKASDYVYNIEVKNDHNYIANGFVTKNCSTSLELGIDIGYVDLVILLDSPKSVARALQRCGRAGHRLHDTTKGRIVVLDRDNLVECSVLLKNAVEKKIDNIHIPKNCLDVLAQQIIGLVLEQVWDYDELLNLVKKSYNYKDLKTEDFNDVLNFLAGEYTSLEDRHVYAKIWWDKEEKKIGKRGKSLRIIYMTNLGTIPDQSGIIVKIGAQAIGQLDESFVEKLKPGDIFVLGGNTYMFKFSRGMVAQVSAAAGRTPTVPSWFSEMLPLSFDLAMDIQRFRSLVEDRLVANETKKDIINFIHSYLYVDDSAAEAIYNYIKEQYDFAMVPSHKKILIEHYIDETDKKYSIFHTLFGRRVNDCLSRAIAHAIARKQKRAVEIGINDNCFYVTHDKDINVIDAFKLLKSDELRKVMDLALDSTEILSRRFRHCAARSFMILKRYKGHEKRVGRQQVSSMILMNSVKRISADFPILKEARREVLEDLMDIDNAINVLKMKENGTLKVKEITTRIPTPFAFNLIVRGSTDIYKAEDKQKFLQRMHSMVLARIGQKK